MSITLKKILVATDGSEDAALAVRAAIDLSNKTDAELHVVHTWRNLQPATLPAVATDEYWRARKQYEQEAGELLEEQAERLRNAGAGLHLREGRPADEIATLAEELEADLVVVGSRGVGTVKRLVMGSVSEAIVHLAPCPVLVMRGGKEAWPPGDVVIGDDSSKEAKRAGELAAYLGRLFGTSALIVRAYSLPRARSASARAAALRMEDAGLQRDKEDLEERAGELESILGRDPHVKVAAGDAAAVIQKLAEEGKKPALVAVGSRGLGVSNASCLAASRQTPCER